MNIAQELEIISKDSLTDSIKLKRAFRESQKIVSGIRVITLIDGSTCAFAGDLDEACAKIERASVHV